MMLLMETTTHGGPGVGPQQAYPRAEGAQPVHTLHPHQVAPQQQQQQQQEEAEEDGQQQEQEQELQVLQPLQPNLQLLPVQLLDVQHACALVSWPQATYTLPEHEHDDEQVAYQLQVHYRVSYTLQLQKVAVGPPTAEQPVQQLLSSVPQAVVDAAWKDVLTLEEAPTQPQTVGSLRAGRFYAVRLRAQAHAELDSGPVHFSDSYTSDVVAFRTLPCAPGQMQAPALARRDRSQLKLKWNLPDETGGEVITQYQLKAKPLPQGVAGSPPDGEGFSIIYDGLGEGPEQAKDRTHFTLKPLGPGQRFSFRIRCFNPLGVGNWSLPSTFTTAPSVPSQPDPPQLVQAAEDGVTLAWQPPADNGSAITFYKLELDDGAGGDFQHVYGGQAEQLSAVLTGLQSGLHYRVRLRAENGEGRSQWSAIQPISTAATLPKCPVGVKLGQITRTNVSLSWSPPDDDGGSPVQEYEVQLLPVSKVAVANLGRDWLAIYQGPGLSTMSTMLHAGCKYQLRVAARNGVGIGQFSLPVPFTTGSDAPMAPPRPTALVETRALYISLQPPVHDGGSAITAYSIRMRCNPLAAAAAAAAAAPPNEPRPFMSTEWTEVWSGEYKGAAVPVPHLLPGTQYEFRAVACNAFGSSAQSEVGSASTLPAEPLPPQAPQLLAAAGSSVTVSWQEPYGQGSPVIKYKLSYACLGPVGGHGSAAAANSTSSSTGHSRSSSIAAPAANGHCELGHAGESGDDTGSVSSGGGMGSSSGPAAVEKLRWEQAYAGPDLSAAVKQLQPAHRYLLRVRAINEIGASHWSQPLSAATAATPPAQPACLSTAAESSSTIAVSWQPPEVDNGAPVTAYQLEMQPAGGSAASWTDVWQGSKLSHTVGGLLPGRKYSFRVRAANLCGVGPWATSGPSSPAPAAPDAPTKLSVSKVTATSAKAKWSFPAQDNGAVVTAYRLQLRQVRGSPGSQAAGASSSSSSSCASDDQSAAEWEEAYTGPALDATLTRLQPGSTYEVRAAALNCVGLGRWSAAAELTTLLRAPPPPTQLAAVADEVQLGSVAVTWQPADPAPDSAAAVSVYLEAAAPGSKEAAAKATVPVAEGAAAVLQGLRPGSTYHIRGRSVGAGSTGHSAWCEPASVTLPAPLVLLEEEAQAGALVVAGAGSSKRVGKGKGAKGAAAKAAVKGEAAGGEVQLRKGGRGRKGVVVEEVAVVLKKPGKKRTVWARVRRSIYFKYLTWCIFAVCLVAVVLYFVRTRREAAEQAV